MKIEQIEAKAKEIASEWQEPSDYNITMEDIAMKAAILMAGWILSHQWVSVKDELPPAMSKDDPISDRVMVHTSLDCIFVDRYNHYYQEWLTAKGHKDDNVTHWMPIPPMAEKGGKNE